MALQIEAPETIRVIQELARRTGQSEERVVDVAVRERLARLRTPEEEAERRARVYALVKELQSSFNIFRGTGRRSRRTPLRRGRLAQVIVDSSALMAIVLDEPVVGEIPPNSPRIANQSHVSGEL